MKATHKVEYDIDRKRYLKEVIEQRWQQKINDLVSAQKVIYPEVTVDSLIKQVESFGKNAGKMNSILELFTYDPDEEPRREVMECKYNGWDLK